ncbi:hypothetical protein AAVH_11150 [Aphelenchoides avenae]|nr:hypothetical protein AAVH_11150 [Aphelenchus avenae]
MSWSERSRSSVRNRSLFAAKAELVNVRGQTEVLRHCRVRYRGYLPREEVTVSAETWRLLKEYDVPATIKRLYNVHIETAQTTSNKVQLTLHDALHVKRREVPQITTLWLKTPAKGAKCARIEDLKRKFDTHVYSGRSTDGSDPTGLVDLVVVGEQEENVDDVLAIFADHDCLVKNPCESAECARIETLKQKFDTYIHPGPCNDGGDPSRLVDLTVVGEREENVDGVIVIIGMDGLHVKRRQIERAVRSWLAHTSKGAERARSFELGRKFGTLIHSGPLSDKDDPDCIIDLAVVGECEENVDNALAIIDGLHVKRHQVPQITSLWLKTPRTGAKCARIEDFRQQFDIDIEPGPYHESSDPARLVDLTVVGEREEKVDSVLSLIVEFDTLIHSEPLDDKDDPGCMVDLAVVGEREDNVDNLLAINRYWLPHFIWAKLAGLLENEVSSNRKFDTCTVLGAHNDESDPTRLVDLTVVGEREKHVDEVLAIIGGLHVKRRRIQRTVRSWLSSPSKGAERALSIELSRKFDTFIHSGSLTDKDDPDCVVDLTVLGEREENVDDVLAIIGGIHVKRRRIERAVRSWLSNRSKGAERARSIELNGKFDTCIVSGPLNDKDDPDCVLEFAVAGEREENVDDVLAITRFILGTVGYREPCAGGYSTLGLEPSVTGERTSTYREFDTRVYIHLNDDMDPTRMEKFAVVGERKEDVEQVLGTIESIVAERVNVTKDQEGLWTGQEDDQNRHVRELEVLTNTHILWDEGEGCLHVSGRSEGVREVVERIRERLDTPPSDGSGR